jgi:hypothetical protein
VVRPRILLTAPIEDTLDLRSEVHIFTSKDDWLNLVWTLKSFYWASGRRYALCIHEDGSLDQSTLELLHQHFPTARIIRRKEADARLTEELRAYPLSLKFRQTNPLAPKLFDFMAYLESDRMALFDSDLLFFAEPTAYLQRVEDPGYRRNTFNRNTPSGHADYDFYTVEPSIVRSRTGVELAPGVNSGFGLVHRDSIRWDWTEEFLALPGMADGHYWRIEQTLFALCSSRFGTELLPDEYTLILAPVPGTPAFRHYNGTIRHLMYGEGIARLMREGFLERHDIRVE